jgi:hypothetical protein
VETIVRVGPAEDGKTRMAFNRRDQRYLAIDSNILVAYLDRDSRNLSCLGVQTEVAAKGSGADTERDLG